MKFLNHFLEFFKLSMKLLGLILVVGKMFLDDFVFILQIEVFSLNS